MCFAMSSQVLPFRDHLPSGGEDSGHAGPEHAGEEAGLVRHHRARWPLRPRTHPAPFLLLRPHQEEPLHLHPGAAAGHGDRPGYLFQVRDSLALICGSVHVLLLVFVFSQLCHAAHHHEVFVGKLQC